MPRESDGLSLTKRIRLCRDPETLARAAALAIARLLVTTGLRGGAVVPPPAPPPGGPWVSLQKGAEMLDVSSKWLWRHRAELPFVETLDGRRWRVNVAKLNEHMARKR